MSKTSCTNRYSSTIKNDISPTSSYQDNLISGLGVIGEVRNNDNMKYNLLGLLDVCNLLKISRSTLYSLVNRGEIKAVKIRNRTLFRATDISDFIANLPEYEGGQNGF